MATVMATTDAAVQAAATEQPGAAADVPAGAGTSAYAVQAAGFEGPFDLLLHLILKDQVDLYEVQLSVIVDEYLAYITRLERLNLEIATEFLLIAATLIELKSRRLLPVSDEMDLDEELALWEERDLLLHRLVECKTFKEAALVLEARAVEVSRTLPRRSGVDERFAGLMPDLLNGVTPDDLRTAFLRATAPKPTPRVDLHHVAPIRITVTDAVVELMEELPLLGRATFRQLTSGLVERLDVVIRFLALLEMYKQGMVDLEQTARFGDISVAWIGGDGMDADQLAAVDGYDG